MVQSRATGAACYIHVHVHDRIWYKARDGGVSKLGRCSQSAVYILNDVYDAMVYMGDRSATEDVGSGR